MSHTGLMRPGVVRLNHGMGRTPHLSGENLRYSARSHKNKYAGHARVDDRFLIDLEREEAQGRVNFARRQVMQAWNG